MKWRLPQGGMLKLKSWNEEAVVYNISTGETHLLGALAAELLASLQRAPATTDELIASLTTSFHLDDVEELEAQVADVLEDLRALTLIEAGAY